MTTTQKRFAPADPALAPGTEHQGFVVEKVEPVPELKAQAYVMRHAATGARLMWLACADENRSFAIAFKTPPADDTGVFHIIEHSVLDGSRRFPVKEPFVHLIKSSMQTFLNALTFSDKTMYPVASTNVADLENLMDVYLDAVLDPDIYRRYTSGDNSRVAENLQWLADHTALEKVTIRLPHIPHYNTQADVARSRQQLEAMGFKDFDCFDYITDR